MKAPTNLGQPSSYQADQVEIGATRSHGCCLRPSVPNKASFGHTMPENGDSDGL